MSYLILSLVLLLFFFPLVYGLYKIAKHLILNVKRRNTQSRDHEKWLRETEPALRNTKDYPEDWQNRRREVFIRSGGSCALCSEKIGVLLGGTLLWNAHVHHIKPLSQGGDHSISNLELLCENCHIKKHPDNKALRVARNWRNLYIGRDATIKKSRRSWVCITCEKQIEAGESYYGKKYRKLCLHCYDKLQKKNQTS